MDPEPASFRHGPYITGLERNNYKTLLTLAYQSFGVAYGELCTSPLYVYKSTFVRKLQYHQNEDAVLGVLSVIFWTVTLIPILQYAFIVLSAHDNGEGGTFALYSLLCRHAKLSPLPNQQMIDEELSTYKLEESDQLQHVTSAKSFIKGHKSVCRGLLIAVLLGTCMVIGDGVLTPAISVLSSLSGLQVAFPGIPDHMVAVISCIIVVCLFTVQHFGTRTISFLFAPIVMAWIFCIALIGIYNIFHWNPRVLQALSPYYIYKFFNYGGRESFVSLGGILLCITGTEAMYADLGHFTQSSLRIGFTSVVYPGLILAYSGQAAYLSKNLSDVESSFYKCIPKQVFWPVFFLGTFASIAGSQAVISATFSIIKQCHALGCFPRVKIVHTSKQMRGQIYIPEINWILMLLCLAVTMGFRDTTAIGDAYGVAAITVMLVTTSLMSPIIVVVWHRSISLAVCFFIFFGTIQGIYFSASLLKVPEGGWVPLVLAFLFMIIMYVWHYGTLKKYQYDIDNKVSLKWILSLGPSLGIVRVPGIGLIYTDLVSGVPSIFSHFVTNLPAFHQVLVFVCIKSVPVPFVPPEERYLVGRIGPKEYRMYRCIARYGYKDLLTGDYDFENQLILNISEFINSEREQLYTPPSSEGSVVDQMSVVSIPGRTGFRMKISTLDDDGLQTLSMSTIFSPTLLSFQDHSEIESSQPRRVRFELPKNFDVAPPSVRQELKELMEAREAGIVYILGHSYVKAKRNSSFIKKLAIDIGYSFLRKNCRGPAAALSIPHICLIEVGMIYIV